MIKYKGVLLQCQVQRVVLIEYKYSWASLGGGGVKGRDIPHTISVEIKNCKIFY